jgi:acyl-CoA thioesterase
MESPRSQHGRGFATAKVWTTDGRLVFSTAQEGVIRVADLPDYPISSKL